MNILPPSSGLKSLHHYVPTVYYVSDRYDLCTGFFPASFYITTLIFRINLQLLYRETRNGCTNLEVGILRRLCSWLDVLDLSGCDLYRGDAPLLQ